jgi:DNA-binding winged helix-turn-helix (wHTH) protein
MTRKPASRATPFRQPETAFSPLFLMQAPTQSKCSYRFGLFDLDLASRKLLRKGEPVRLQELPFRFLTILLERAGEIVTREELRQSLWPEGTYVEFNGSLNAALKKLRFALGDDAENPIFIETVPKRGYRFIRAGGMRAARRDQRVGFGAGVRSFAGHTREACG